MADSTNVLPNIKEVNAPILLAQLLLITFSAFNEWHLLELEWGRVVKTILSSDLSWHFSQHRRNRKCSYFYETHDLKSIITTYPEGYKYHYTQVMISHGKGTCSGCGSSQVQVGSQDLL